MQTSTQSKVLGLHRPTGALDCHYTTEKRSTASVAQTYRNVRVLKPRNDIWRKINGSFHKNTQRTSFINESNLRITPRIIPRRIVFFLKIKKKLLDGKRFVYNEMESTAELAAVFGSFTILATNRVSKLLNIVGQSVSTVSRN